VTGALLEENMEAPTGERPSGVGYAEVSPLQPTREYGERHEFPSEVRG